MGLCLPRCTTQARSSSQVEPRRWMAGSRRNGHDEPRWTVITRGQEAWCSHLRLSRGDVAPRSCRTATEPGPSAIATWRSFDQAGWARLFTINWNWLDAGSCRGNRLRTHIAPETAHRAVCDTVWPKGGTRGIFWRLAD